MFGHDDNTQVAPQDSSDVQDPAAQMAASLMADPSEPADPAVATPSTDTATPTYGDNAATNSPSPAPQDVTTPAVPAVEPVTTDAPDEGDATDELLDIKQQALQQLSPLVGHLDQSAEEKFRTTMMMIQASDNQGLIKEAYAAAQQIQDEKTRAQALLDIVNEINYFTQQQVQ